MREAKVRENKNAKSREAMPCPKMNDKIMEDSL
jgi:hypothetical protein